jgi:hypothetical protein
MVHIIGVAHRAQVTSPGTELTEDQKRLSDRLSQLAQEVGATLIAEEQSLEALGNNVSLSKQTAQNRNIEHRFCDPDSHERAAMGYRDRQSIGQEIFFSDEGWELSPTEIDAKAGAIEIARYFPLRERFWFEGLADRVDSEIAFVCGDAHVEGFVGLLKEKGIPYRVCDRGIGLNDEDKYVFGNAMKYLEQHPEIRDH